MPSTCVKCMNKCIIHSFIHSHIYFDINKFNVNIKVCDWTQKLVETWNENKKCPSEIRFMLDEKGNQQKKE